MYCMVNQRFLPYSKAKEFIQEGDILLFRGHGIFSWFIRRYSLSSYSHIGIASIADNNIIECIEFREFKGGRTINLETQLRCNIDVFRVSPYVEKLTVDYNDNNEPLPYFTRFEYNGKNTTDKMRTMTGLDYNWKFIWLIARTKIPILRIFEPIKMGDCVEGNKVLQICSSAIAQAFEETFLDIFPDRPNALIEPSDFSQSPVLNYIFTIEKLNEKKTA